MKFDIKIDENEVDKFELEQSPSFGANQLPITLFFDLNAKNIVPEVVTVSTQKEFTMSCFNSTLHYGQSIFEGMKAYRMDDGKIGVFRLEDHAKRFMNSARIMGMPQIPVDVFRQCILKFLENTHALMPAGNLSLYLRPLLIGNDNIIKVRPSENYRFFIMGSIVGDYFSGQSKGTKVYCNREFVRAFPYGTGEAKTSANYAMSLPNLVHAQSLGYQQVLYLNAVDKENIDELGGMNFFALKENKLITPKLSGTILRGVTRNCILEIAKHFDLATCEQDITIKELMEDLSIQAIFASGTAATVAPIVELGYQKNHESELVKRQFEFNETVTKIRNFLSETQRNRTELSKQWLEIL